MFLRLPVGSKTKIFMLNRYNIADAKYVQEQLGAGLDPKTKNDPNANQNYLLLAQ
jgi:hypothetical protein